jgi:hypothetical protein
MKPGPSLKFGLARLRSEGGRLLRDRCGATAIITGLASTVIIGFAGFGIDVASWELAQRNMQGAADQAAYSAAVASAAGGGASPITQAEGIAASFGYVNDVNNTTVQVSTGSYAGYSDAFQVVIQQTQPQWFANLFLSSPPTVAAQAVAALTGGSACIIALQSSGQDGLDVTGSGTVNVSTCDVYVNSSDTKALEVQGGSATLDAKDAYIVGNDNISGGATFSVSGTLKTGASAVADPYASRTAPSNTTCGSNPTTNSASAGTPSNFNWNNITYPATIYPGVYCSGINPNGPLTLSPGVYILTGNNSSLQVQGGSSSDPTLSNGQCTTSTNKAYVNATGGVTIYLASGTQNNGIQVSSCLAITAPTSGNTAGIAFWVDKGNSSNGKDQFNGGSNVAITGAIYAPSQEVDYTGSSSATSSCTQIVANKIDFTGAADFQHNCAGIGVSDPAGGSGAPKVVQ